MSVGTYSHVCLNIAGCSIEGTRMTAQIKLGLWNGYHHETNPDVACNSSHNHMWHTSTIAFNFGLHHSVEECRSICQ